MADWVVNTRRTFAENYYFRKIINTPKDFYHSVTGKSSQTKTGLCLVQFLKQKSINCLRLHALLLLFFVCMPYFSLVL